LALGEFIPVSSSLGAAWGDKTHACVLDSTQQESEVRRWPDLALGECPEEILDAVSGPCVDVFEGAYIHPLVAPAGGNGVTD
jgi:hypothetical protein